MKKSWPNWANWPCRSGRSSPTTLMRPKSGPVCEIWCGGHVLMIQLWLGIACDYVYIYMIIYICMIIYIYA